MLDGYGVGVPAMERGRPEETAQTRAVLNLVEGQNPGDTAAQATNLLEALIHTAVAAGLSQDGLIEFVADMVPLYPRWGEPL
jgi:hypothetical protein